MSIPVAEKNNHSSTLLPLDFRVITPGESRKLKASREREGSEELSKVMPQCSQTAERRGELKYLMTEEVYRMFRAASQEYLEPDSFACSLVSSLYLDNDDNAIIRRSLEKPPYKEKLRIRTYVDEPGPGDTCFFEIKKKFKGTVFKRRVEMTLGEALSFCRNGKRPEETLTALSDADRRTALQILQEIEWLFMLYGDLRPSFLVSCKRLSLKEKTTDSLRITFDRDLRWSFDRQREFLGSATNALIDPASRIMEIKSTKGMPFWLIEVLNELELRPQSFSKVGKSYGAWLQKTKGSK